MLLMYICLYNVVNSMSAVIGCMPMIYQSTETVFLLSQELVFYVLFNMVRGFENVCEIFFSSPFNVFVFTTF